MNYREAGGDSLKSIMRLPKEEAFEVARHLSENSKAGNNRYGMYFELYYQKRLRTEEWLYSEFSRKGSPKTLHPIYFTLCESPSMEHFYGVKDKKYLRLSDVPEDSISFTPRDSMHLKDMGLLKGTVWNKEDLFKLLSEPGKGVGNMIVNLPGLYGQVGGSIEAQLWNDECLNYVLEGIRH